MYRTERTMHLGTSLRPLCAVRMLRCCGEEAWRGPNQVENSTVVVTRGPVIRIPHLNSGLNHGGSAGYTNGHKGGGSWVLHHSKGE